MQPSGQTAAYLLFWLAFCLYKLYRRRHQTPTLVRIWKSVDAIWPIYEKGLLLGFRSFVFAFVLTILLAFLEGVLLAVGVDIWPLLPVVVLVAFFRLLFLWWRETRWGF